jgi:hypothetical protein
MRPARELGMQAAIAHAGDDWRDQATRELVRFAREHGAAFLVEAARHAAAERGLEAPPDSRAWGAVTKRAHRAGLIEPAGFAQGSNGSPKPMWRASRCRDWPLREGA